MILPSKKKPVWEKLGIHPDQMKSYLKVRGKSLKRLSGWFVVAGVVFAVQTTYSLDAQKNLVARQQTIVDHSTDDQNSDARAPHTIKHYTATFVFLTDIGSLVWNVPSNWNNNDNKVECIGGGGGSAGAANSGASGGAGGGAYSASTNLNFTDVTVVNYSVGAAGAAGVAQYSNGTSGGDTWFSSTSTLLAKGGARSLHSDNNFTTGGAGGASGSGVGSVRRSGGKGANGSTGAGSGGGGAGGPNGSGNAGSSTSFNGGSGDAGHGGAGGSSSHAAGGNGTNMGGGSVGPGGGGFGITKTGTGGLYGGGAGGATGSNGHWFQGSAGAKGIIVITYTPLVAPTISSVSPSSGFIIGGDSITLTGANLTDATSVKFGGTSATNVSVNSSTNITCKTPAHAEGTVDVTVTTPGGTGTLSSGFTYLTTPEPAGVPYIYGI